jgi:RNA polymerase sigma factor (TIGR02999 family)
MSAPNDTPSSQGADGPVDGRGEPGPVGDAGTSLEGDITQLLGAARQGDAEALGRLLPLVYDLLREQARRALAGERSGHTLQPTALVHEAWMRLARQRDAAWGDRHHFLATAAMMMRRILVSHARGRRRLKRGGGSVPLEFDHALADTLADPDAGANAHDAQTDLIALASLDARLVRTVELRYFAGLSVEEAAEVLGVGSATVKRDWAFAKAWLREHLDPAEDRS